MNGGFFMKKIELEYRFELDENVEVKNIVVADQKEIFEHSNELLIKGKVFFEIEYLNGEIINKTVAKLPICVGDVIVENVFGCNIIATQNKEL